MHVFYVTAICLVLSLILKTSFLLSLVPKRIINVKMVILGATRFYSSDNLNSRYKYLSTLVTDILGNEELEFSIDWR